MKRPIQLLIADDIRTQIESGALPPGAALPAIHELAERWSCSVGSARTAITLLREQGLISGGRGKPLMVRTQHRRAIRDSARHQLEKDLVRRPLEERAPVGTSELETGTSIHSVKFDCTYDVIRATTNIADRFKIPAGAKVLRRMYQTTDPDTGSWLARSVSHIPVELIRSNPDLMDASNEPWPGGTQHQLSTVGIEIARIVDEVTAQMPTTVDRQRWDLELLRNLRTSIDTAGRVVELSDATYPADRTLLRFTTPLQPWSQ